MPILDGQGLRSQLHVLQAMLIQQNMQLRQLQASNGTATHPPGRLVDAIARLFLIQGQVERAVEVFADQLTQRDPKTYGEDEWSRLSILTRQCRAFAADCVSMEQTVNYRNALLAVSKSRYPTARVMGAADGLVEELGGKVGKRQSSYVLLSETEHFQPEISAIHLGYCGLSIWNLNRTAHEFGHQWAEERDRDEGGPQRIFLKNMKALWEQESLAKELFADIVATFWTGLAYAYACMFLDFNPADRKSSASHPSDDERAHCILIVLKELAEDMPPDHQAPMMRRLIRELDQFWSAARESAGAGGPPRSLETLRAEVPIVVTKLKDEISRAQFKDLALPLEVKGALRRKPLKRPAGSDMTSVLNGAWLARLETDEANITGLEQAGLDLLLDAGGAVEQAS